MKEPKRPYFNSTEPKKVITTITKLATIGLGGYGETWTIEQWYALVNDHIKGKDKSNIHILFEKRSGYYGETSCELIIEERITTTNVQYDRQMKEYKELVNENKQAMIDYHRAMAEYHTKIAK